MFSIVVGLTNMVAIYLQIVLSPKLSNLNRRTDFLTPQEVFLVITFLLRKLTACLVLCRLRPRRRRRRRLAVPSAGNSTSAASSTLWPTSAGRRDPTPTHKNIVMYRQIKAWQRHNGYFGSFSYKQLGLQEQNNCITLNFHEAHSVGDMDLRANIYAPQ